MRCVTTTTTTREARRRSRLVSIATVCVAFQRSRALERDDDDDGRTRGLDDDEGARASADAARERLTRIRTVLRAKGSVGTPRVDAVWWINTDWTRIVDRRCTRRWRRRRTIEICVR